MRYAALLTIKLLAVLALVFLTAVKSYGQTTLIPLAVANLDTFGASDIYLYDISNGTFDVIISDGYGNDEPAVSPDNSKLVFSSNRTGTIELYLFDLTTRETLQITHDSSASEGFPTWDWASRRIAYTAARKLYVYDVDTGAAENIAEGYGFLDPQWSPDGERIAFSSIQSRNELWRLYILDLTTGMIAPAVPPEVIADSPKWSPDGSMIGFWGNQQIYVLDLASGQITQVTDEIETNDFAWLQDNTILYRTMEGGSSGSLFQIHPDGTNRHPVPIPLPYFPYLQSLDLPNLLVISIPTPTPTFTPSPTATLTPTPTATPFAGGGNIVFECMDAICLADYWNTYITDGVQPHIGEGNRIAHAQYFFHPNIPSSITIFDTDDSSMVTAVSGMGTYIEPALSPDGTKVAYAFKPAGSNQKFDVRTVNVDGTNAQTLTSTSYNSRRPDWLPDGTKIVFYADSGGDNEIYVMNADGSGLTALTANTSNDIDPRWSPDGTQIAFSANRDGNPEIYRMNADGSNPVRLTNNPVIDVEPSWSPDGTQIVFSSRRSSVSATTGMIYRIYHMAAADGAGVTLDSVTTETLTDYRNPDWGSIIPPPPGCPEGTCLMSPTSAPEE